MKFGDIIIAVASLTVAFFLFACVLLIALIPMNTYWGAIVPVIVSILVSGLVVGYVFAGKIQEESKMASIGKIVVLFAVVMVFVVMMVYSPLGHYSAMVDEHLRNMYSTGSWTNTDWFAYELMALVMNAALFAVFALVFGFIGLYVGSMLRRPAKKGK